MAPRLDGRTVVVTRGRGGEDELSARLRALGAEVREVAAIRFEGPADPGPLDAALRGLSAFEWVVFASATAVEHTLSRLDLLGIPRAELAARRIAAVGPVTAGRLESSLGRAPDLVPPAATGEALASALRARVSGRRVLLPRPAEGRPETVDGLEAAGADLVAVEAYRTVPADRATLAPLGRWLAAGEVDAVAFASPSAVKAVVAGLGTEARTLLGGRVLLAAIGPTTAQALREMGLAARAEPARHTGADLAEAIAATLATA
jgi:uroporphyrinogen-III synthase/uroporphyrinogen III methyltransferase/synthase